MRVHIHRQFEKQFQKLPSDIQEQFRERLVLFITVPTHPLLRVHALKGNKYPYMSLNVSGDYRALFLYQGDGVTFYEIGTHSELYR